MSCLSGTCRTACVCVCPGNAMKMKILQTSCTHSSHTSPSPRTKVNYCVTVTWQHHSSVVRCVFSVFAVFMSLCKVSEYSEKCLQIKCIIYYISEVLTVCWMKSVFVCQSLYLFFLHCVSLKTISNIVLFLCPQVFRLLMWMKINFLFMSVGIKT